MESNNKYFKEKFDGFEQRPSLGVWKDLDDKLAAKERKGKIVFMMRIAAGIILILVSAFFIYQNESNTKELVEEKLIESETKEQLAHQGFINDENKGIEEQKEVSKEQKGQIKNQKSADVIKDQADQKVDKIQEKVVKSRKEIETPKTDLEDFIESLLPEKVQLVENEMGDSDSTSNLNASPIIGDAQQKALAVDNSEEESISQMNSKNENSKHDLLTESIDSRSVTIILKPIIIENDESIEVKDDRNTLEKIKEAMHMDLYKQRFRIGGISE